MSGRLYYKIGALALVVLTTGCALSRNKNPHNDVLVFATHTKLGVDISAPLNSATLPAFNVGYNRAEAVWMPLRPNGLNNDWMLSERGVVEITNDLTKCTQSLMALIPNTDDRNRACLATVLPQAKYVSMASGIETGKGGANLEIDTYSVFASFGARGGVSGSGAQGGLAQVFATGIAAQRLAANPQVGAALNAAAPQAIVAQAQADVAESAAAINALDEQEALMKVIRGPWACGDPATDNAKFKAMITDADPTSSNGWWTIIGGSKDKTSAVQNIGYGDAGLMKQFIASQTKICSGG